MNTVVTHWQTSLAGLLAGAAYAAAQMYKPGMTWKDWGVAILIAAVGLLSKDHNKN